MKGSARPRKRKKRRSSLFADLLGATGRAIAERPVGVGAVTAFAITFSFVGANAVWYQPHAHPGAFFQTRETRDRPPLEPVDVTRLEIRDAPADGGTLPSDPKIVPSDGSATLPAPTPTGDRTVTSEVQRRLGELGLYDGSVDGLVGPQTNAAVSAYRQRNGLAEGHAIDDELLQHLRGQQVDLGTDAIQTASAPGASGDQRTLRVQAALRAFGNQGIELDGRVGQRTRDALVEFQSLFGLPQTGAADEATYAKMREIGLAN